MTYLSPPGADDPRQQGSESAVPQADPTYPPQPDPLYQAYQPYQAPGSGYPPPPEYPYQSGPYQASPYQPGPYQQPYAPMGYPAPRQTDGMAIASLVVSCVGVLGLCAYGIGGLVGIVGAVLGHVARGRIQRSGADGDAMALTGIIMGWVATGLAILAIAFLVIFFAIISNTETATAT